MINHDTRTVNVWWPRTPRPGNFGDIVTPYLVDRLGSYKARFVPMPLEGPALIATGSILGRANLHATVWGSGAMRESDRICPDAHYVAVRGPLSAELVEAACGRRVTVQGDPALLLPILYSPPASPKYEYGFFPHYVDYDAVMSWYGERPDVKIINPLRENIEDVIDDIRSCKRIISSSLHGIIVAQAYGVPATWVKFSNKLVGDGIKFRDYFASVGIDMRCTEMFERPSKFDDFYKLTYTADIAFDPAPLMRSYPVTP